MDPKLFEAACSGNTNQLHALLEADRFILERNSLANDPESCLHVATLAGKIDFVKEILRRKPELANRPNKDGFSPIHIASTNGYAEIVRELLRSNESLGRHESGDGRIALHFAVITGSVDVIRELLCISPECMGDLTIKSETALHLAVKNTQFEAFKLLVERLSEFNDEEEKRKLINAKDEDGNTVLHIATFRNQLRTVKFLMGGQSIAADLVEVNATNNDGFTVFDIVDNQQPIASKPSYNDLRELLQRIKNQNLANQSASTSSAFHPVDENNPTHTMMSLSGRLWKLWKELTKDVPNLDPRTLWISLKKEVESSSTETRSALMVVAVLIATVTYQAVLSPPAGFQNQESNSEHSNGTAAMASDLLIFILVTFLNSLAFAASVVIILLLTSRFPLKALLRLAVIAMAATFVCTVFYIAPIKFNVAFIVIIVMFIIVMMQLLYFTLWWGKTCRKFRRRDSGVPVTETYNGA